MTDEELIRRGDALSLFPTIDDLRHMTVGHATVFFAERRVAIRALPAVQPTVKPLRYIEPEGETLEQMRDHARQQPLAREGDMRLVWVNEGDLHMHTIFHAVQGESHE